MKRRNTTKEPNKILASSSDVCQNHHLWISRRFFFQLISVLYLFMNSFSSFLFNLVSRPLKIPEMKKCELPTDVMLRQVYLFHVFARSSKKLFASKKQKNTQIIITFVFHKDFAYLEGKHLTKFEFKIYIYIKLTKFNKISIW